MKISKKILSSFYFTSLFISAIFFILLAIEEPDNNGLMVFGICHSLLVFLYLLWKQEKSQGISLNAAKIKRLLFIFFPLTAIIYVVFSQLPKISSRFLPKTSIGISGFSLDKNFEPGSISNLMLKQDVFFRAWFQNKKIPSQENLYWRGYVYNKSEGLKWKAQNLLKSSTSDAFELQHDIKSQPLAEIFVVQLLIEPKPSRLIFGLDWPIKTSTEGDSYLLPGNITLPSSVKFNQPLSAFVTSYVNQNEQTSPPVKLTSLEATTYTDVSFQPSKKLLSFVSKWKENSHLSFDSVTKKIQNYFKNNNFMYSLNPGTYPSQNFSNSQESPESLGAIAFDEFFFGRRIGFCEHFSAATATLYRLLGFPSRLVVGFQGGRRFDSVGSVSVRESDSHAWVEVYNAVISKWVRVDPTVWIAPSRIFNENKIENNFFSQDLKNFMFSKQFKNMSEILKNQFEPIRSFWAFLIFDIRTGKWDSFWEKSFLILTDLFLSKEFLFFVLFVLILCIYFNFFIKKKLNHVSKELKFLKKVEFLQNNFLRRLQKKHGIAKNNWESVASVSLNRKDNLSQEERLLITNICNGLLKLTYSVEKVSVKKKIFKEVVKNIANF
jgi:protein-glutamine gamma-glutamyltransferase